MTRFWRDGHWRSGPYGDQHWVSGHWVDRNGSWGHNPAGWQGLSGSGASEPDGRNLLDTNARCPVCGAAVIYYENEFGSKVYFDELAPLWTKHPCTDNSAETGPKLLATPIGATTPGSRFRHQDLDDLDDTQTHHVPGAFVVTRVEKQGRRRIVTLREFGGKDIWVEVSPPPPPIGAIAMEVTFNIHWFDPASQQKGSNPVWRRSD